MITHITGMDATGKSTLSEKLCKELNGEYIHFSNPKDMNDGREQYLNFLRQVDKNKTYICDRFHDGEWVYAPIYRNYKACYMNEIESEIKKTDKYMLAYIYADLETIKERIKVRGEDFVKEEHYQLVIDNFKNNFLMEQQLPFTMINTSSGTVESNYELLKKSFEKVNSILEKECKIQPRGNINAKYMVVSNIEKNGVVMPKDNKLCKQLIEAGIYLDCWFTHIDSENSENVLEQLNIIMPKEIITTDPITYSLIRQRLQAGKDRVILMDDNDYDKVEMLKVLNNM